MNLILKEIASRDVWERFIETAQPHTFLHSWNWGEFNQAMGQKIWRFGFFDGDTLIGVAFVFKVTARRGSFLFCPHGPIVMTNYHRQGGAGELRITKLLTDHLKKIGKEERCDFIRMSPLMAKTPENDGLFLENGYREAPVHMMHPELAWILDVTPTEEALLAAMRKNTRYAVRRAEKDGVTITRSSDPQDLDRFFSLYDETVGRQHFTPFSRGYFQKEFEIFGKDGDAALFFAHYQSEVVSTAFIVFSKNSAFYHHGASTPKFPQLTASHLLQWEVIREAKHRGCSQYNFWGVSPESEPKHPWAGLSLFKRGFGGFAEEYVHAKDLPITPKYWLNWVVEKTRKIRRGY